MQAAQAVTAAINAYTPPSTHTIVPKPGRASSKAWKYGLKLKVNSTGKFVYACFGDSTCRTNSEKGIFIGLSKDALSNATDHITAKHNACK